ncbi:MAG: D-alanine--D-alanine ligase, partial [Planctomycetes bacterium]|nr:D-alanine--D-alanine ligase [Planctomycetota bacterium]
WIIKPVDCHASLFIDAASVLRNAERAELVRRLAEAQSKHGRHFFAERFVDGREFNLSVLEGAGGGPELLPVAEISFAAFPPDQPRIVGHAAKWDEESPEYRGTQRVFPEDIGDGELRRELSRLALAAWNAFGLAGYARMDFRVNAAGKPYLLEVNANPCLAPDSGFAAAAGRMGMAYEELIQRIAEAGLRLG